MTVKKAIKILDWWIKQKKIGIDKLKVDENFHDKELEKTILHYDKTIISNLEVIRKELVPNCKHPKKMQDVDSNGNLYCMDCNLDL